MSVYVWLQGDDQWLFAALIKALGVFMQCAGRCSLLNRMATTYIEYVAPIVQGPLCRAHCAGPIVQGPLCRAHCAGPTVQGPLCRAHCAGPIVQGPLCRAHCAGNRAFTPPPVLQVSAGSVPPSKPRADSSSSLLPDDATANCGRGGPTGRACDCYS